MRIGYARDVQSTPILQTQIDMLKSANCKKIFVSRRALEKADIMQITNYFIREGEGTIIVCKLLCLDKSLKEITIFFHQLDKLNLSFESIKDNLVIDRSQWDIAFSAIHLYQNLKFEKFEDE
jgi:DNA invertase Pin-like site-specific DNA recombinase